MKTGIFSGSFDPPTNGHLWIIQQSKKLFDELHVAIGPHPGKQSTFPTDERIRMLKACGVDAEVLETNIVDYAKQFTNPFLVRGIRDSDDLHYERNIQERVSELSSLQTFYLVPPIDLMVSSTEVKEAYTSGKPYAHLVPPPVLERMKAFHNWLVCTPDVNSIFERGTAGFAPSPCETFTSSLGHVYHMEDSTEIKIEDKVINWHWSKNNIIFFGKMRNHFEQMVRAGLIDYAQTITDDQVRDMLEPFPVDLVNSGAFILRQFPIQYANPTGERYLPCSQSLGPVIIDVNKWKQELGPNLVIEGKHRFLDAKENGEKFILAWVGNLVSV